MTRDCSDSIPSVLERGLCALRAGDFFEAHELFEEVFRVARGRERLCAHGLAQLAASHHQLSLGRARASASTWRKARDKLLAAAIPISRLAADMERFHAALGVSEQGPRFIALERLPPRASWPVL